MVWYGCTAVMLVQLKVWYFITGNPPKTCKKQSNRYSDEDDQRTLCFYFLTMTFNIDLGL